MSDKLPCPKCGGKGSLNVLTRTIGTDGTCQTCDGTGKVSNEQYTILSKGQTNQTISWAIFFVVIVAFMFLMLWFGLSSM